MGVEIPELDDREYAEMIEEARKRIPVYSDEWTDHNAHDPGITVLETLAWIAETYIYQLDRVTDAHRMKYLQLMGEWPRPPEPASVRLKATIATEQPRGSRGATDRNGQTLDGERIDEGTELVVRDGTGVERRFETAEPITLTRATIARIVSEYREGRVDNSTANDVDGMHFLPFGERAEAGSEMYLGFDGDPFANANHLDLTVIFYEVGLPEPASHGEETVDFEPSVGVSWQYCIDYSNWFLDENWKELRIRRDETNRFYQGGVITIEKPAGWGTANGGVDGATILDQIEEFVWIRCRVETPGYEVPPRLDSIDTNVVEARHRSKVENRTLRRSDRSSGTRGVAPRAAGELTERRQVPTEETTALPGQTFVFPRDLAGTPPSHEAERTPVREPILEAEIVVGNEADGWDDAEPWREVMDFDASGPDDTNYVLDQSRGELRFGDGVRGKVPEAGRNVGARWYVHGGGTSGNVPMSSTFRFLSEEYADKTHEVKALGPAEGGTEAESVSDALLRLRRDLTTPYRAVSAEDYRYIAENTPGLRFGRAKALVRDGGNGKGSKDHRTVSVVTVPFSTLRKPVPSEGFLNAVQRHLERHRLLTDRVSVEPPTYVGIGIAAEIRIAPGYRVARRVEETKRTLDEFLSPLPQKELGTKGWPFGRPLYMSEVYAVIEGVEGVDSVLDVSITARGEETSPDIDDEGNALIADSALLYPEDHEVVARTSGRADGAGT